MPRKVPAVAAVPAGEAEAPAAVAVVGEDMGFKARALGESFPETVLLFRHIKQYFHVEAVIRIPDRNIAAIFSGNAFDP